VLGKWMKADTQSVLGGEYAAPGLVRV
jgi:hypothetical protein